MGTIHFISASGERRTEEAQDAPSREVVEAFVAGDREAVWVLFNEKRTCMYVNENGIRLELPVNAVATEIYRDWPRRKGMDVSGRHIHGNAIVLENIEVN